MASKYARIKPTGKTQAERDAISLGRIESFLDGIAAGHMQCPTCQNEYEIKQVDSAVIQALKIRYDKIRPTLSAVEQTNVEPEKALSESDLLAKMGELIAAYPDLAQQAIGEYARKQHDAKQQSVDTAVASTPQVISK
jgi:hypothetical protein